MGFDVFLVLLADLSCELARLLDLEIAICHLILLVVSLCVPAGIDDGLQQTHCSEADLLRFQWLPVGSSNLADGVWALDDLDEALKATILFLSLI